MTAIGGIIDDLRQKRLWPIAAVLLVALVAVPVVLSKSPTTKGSGSAATSSPGSGSAGATQAVSVQTSAPSTQLSGPSRDPFAQQAGGASSASASGGSVGTPVTAASGSSGTTGGTGSTGSTGSTGASGQTGTSNSAPAATSQSTTSSESEPTPAIPKTPHQSAPAGLTATESYRVALAITNAGGGFDTLDPLKRLSILPSTRQGLMVELGVLHGGHRVLFALQPGAVVKGPGSCTPGPIDCQILSLGENQIEQLSKRSSSAAVPVASFAITAISADHHSSAAAATKARRAESAAGRSLLRKSTLSALSLFQYEPSTGDVVDLRNLVIGGS